LSRSYRESSTNGLRSKEFFYSGVTAESDDEDKAALSIIAAILLVSLETI
jgi:hypothetical protein